MSARNHPQIDYYRGGNYRMNESALGSDEIKDLCNALATNEVRSLSLSGVTVTDKEFRKVMTAIGICRSLCTLNVGDGFLQNLDRIEGLCEALNLNRGLTALLLQRNNLSDQAAFILCRTIKLHPTIRTLDLSDCNLSDRGIQHISTLLAGDKGKLGLEQLNLGSNESVTKSGWEHFAMALASDSSLTSLKLYYNDLGDHAAGLVIIALAATKSVVNLDLESTNISDPTAKALYDLLSGFTTHIRDINLSGNRITRTLMEKIKQQLSFYSAIQVNNQSYLPSIATGNLSNYPTAPYYLPSKESFDRPSTVDEESVVELDEDEQENITAKELRDRIQRNAITENAHSHSEVNTYEEAIIEENTQLMRPVSQHSSRRGNSRQNSAQSSERSPTPTFSTLKPSARIGTAHPGVRKKLISSNQLQDVESSLGAATPESFTHNEKVSNTSGNSTPVTDEELRRASPLKSYEYIPRPDIQNEASMDSSRISMKSKSFERSLKTKQLSKSATFAPTSQKSESLKKSLTDGDASLFYNDATENQLSSEDTMVTSSSIHEEMPVEELYGSNVRSSETYRIPNEDELNLPENNSSLNEVLRENIVSVSNRMIDHGLHAEAAIASDNRSYSSGSIPNSLKDILSRSASSTVFRENTREYSYAERDGPSERTSTSSMLRVNERSSYSKMLQEN